MRKTNFLTIIGIQIVLIFFFAIPVSAQNYVVNSNIDAVAANLVTGETATPGQITFRSAIQAATAQPGSHIITFSGAVVSPINLSLGQITVGSAANGNNITITITGPGMNSLTVNQTTEVRMLSTGTGAVTFLLQNITLNYTGPSVTPYSGGGGAIIAGGLNSVTTLINCRISNFQRQIGNGGAISASSTGNSHTMTITNCEFNNNRCGGAGGAVSYLGLGTATISGTLFSGNVTGPVGANTGGDGGAVNVSGNGNGGTYTVEKNTFLNNQVLNNTGHAGAIMNTNGALTARYNRFIGNTCANVANPPLANIIGQAGGATVHTTIADNNWWGVNTGPSANDATALAAGAVMTLTKWLQLKTTASPNSICASTPSNLGNTSSITTSFLSNSASEAIAVGNLTTVIGLPVTWTSTLGSLSGQQGTIQGTGTATATFTSNGTGGTATVNTQVDNIPVGEISPARASITVNTLSTAPTGATGTTTICNGSNTTLTVNGGTKGTAAVTQWFTGSCGGASAGTGDAIVVSPTSTTTYFVRYSGTCNTTTCGTVIVTVNQPSVAPSSITGTTTICNGGSTTLTASGGTLGTSANYQWGTGAVVGTSPIGGATNISLMVSPTSTTTYWVRIENTSAPCTGTTGGVTQLVTVNQPSVAPSSITGTTTICNGGSTTLTAAGGTLGTGANYQWGTGVVVGTAPIGGATNISLMVSPTSTTTYWVRIQNTAAPCTGTTGGVTQLVTVNQPSVAPSSISGTTTICSGGSTTLTAVGGTLGTGANYQWGTGAVVGTNPIALATNSTLNTGSLGANTTYWVRIENTTAPCTGTTSGVTQLVTIAPNNTSTLTSAPGTDMQVANQFSPITPITYGTTGATGANFAGLPPGVTGNWVPNTATISGSPTAQGLYNYSVTLTGGCGTIISNGSINVSPALPVTIVRFTGKLNSDKTVTLQWKVEAQQDIVEYIVEESADGITYSQLGSVAAGNGTAATYSYIDMQVATGINYYRLKIVELSGKISYSNIVVVNLKAGITVILYPNPVTDQLTIQQFGNIQNKTAVLSDAHGRTLLQIRLTNLQQTVNMEAYPSGVYIVKMEDGTAFKVVKQ